MRPATEQAGPVDEPPGSTQVVRRPCVDGRDGAVRLGGTGRGERTHLPLAEDDPAGLLQPSHRGRVVRRHEVGVDERVRRGRDVRGVVVVLDAQGDSAQQAGAAPVGLDRLGAGAVGGDGIERPVDRVELLDPVQVRLDQVDRGQLMAPQQGDRLGDRRLGRVGPRFRADVDIRHEGHGWRGYRLGRRRRGHRRQCRERGAPGRHGCRSGEEDPPVDLAAHRPA